MSENTEQDLTIGLTQYDVINNLINKLDKIHYNNYELNQQNIWRNTGEKIRLKDLEIEKLELEKELKEQKEKNKRLEQSIEDLKKAKEELQSKIDIITAEPIR